MEQGSFWLGVVTLVVSGLFGAGGIAALWRVNVDRRSSISQQEVSEDDAIAKRWQDIVQTQTEALVAPLRESVTSLESKVAGLEQDLAASRRKYWSAVTYIRSLLTWIGRHMPSDADPGLPQPPASLAEDI